MRNDRGEAEKNDLPNLTSAPRPFYYPDVPGPEPAVFMQRLFADHLAIGVEDPTLGAYAATSEARGNELAQLPADRTAAIVMGREPLGAWEGFVRDWKARGGDQIRKEYEDALRSS